MNRMYGYIPDRRMYGAVMRVLELMDEYNEDIEKACDSVSCYFKVNRARLIEHVKLKIEEPRKLPASRCRWYIVEVCTRSDLAPNGEIRRLQVCRSRKATSACAVYKSETSTTRALGDVEGYATEGEARGALQRLNELGVG